MATQATSRSLLGNRGRALYPPRTNPSLVSRRGVPGSAPSGNGGSLFSRQSLMLLTLGVLFGYLFLPMLLVQHLGFDDIHVIAKTKDPSSIERLRKGMGDQMPKYEHERSSVASQRFLIPTEETPEEETDVQSGDSDEAKNAVSAGKETLLAQKSKAKGKAKTVLTPDNVLAPENKNADVSSDVKLSAIQERLLEDHDLMSKQSIPTATSPTVMTTAKLPDSRRMKILITGGAGFVGSHLVDKLMMEGHEVIVADNFFTGQRKNIAHWLHHPNFRWVIVMSFSHVVLGKRHLDSLYCCPWKESH